LLISGSSRRDDPSGTSARKGFLQRLFQSKTTLHFQLEWKAGANGIRLTGF
jgi:hypothetical protein